jgi:hypothetical protein
VLRQEKNDNNGEEAGRDDDGKHAVAWSKRKVTDVSALSWRSIDWDKGRAPSPVGKDAELQISQGTVSLNFNRSRILISQQSRQRYQLIGRKRSVTESSGTKVTTRGVLLMTKGIVTRPEAKPRHLRVVMSASWKGNRKVGLIRVAEHNRLVLKKNPETYDDLRHELETSVAERVNDIATSNLADVGCRRDKDIAEGVEDRDKDVGLGTSETGSRVGLQPANFSREWRTV